MVQVKRKGETMNIKVEVEPVKSFRVFIDGEDRGIFQVVSKWEGLMKLRNAGGSSIIASSEESDGIGGIFADIFESKEKRTLSVVTMSSSLVVSEECEQPQK